MSYIDMSFAHTMLGDDKFWRLFREAQSPVAGAAAALFSIVNELASDKVDSILGHKYVTPVVAAPLLLKMITLSFVVAQVEGTRPAMTETTKAAADDAENTLQEILDGKRKVSGLVALTGEWIPTSYAGNQNAVLDATRLDRLLP